MIMHMVSCARASLNSDFIEVKFFDHYKDPYKPVVLGVAEGVPIKSWISNGRFEDVIPMVDPQDRRTVLAELQLNVRMVYPSNFDPVHHAPSPRLNQVSYS
jgi:hypothetical protein